MRKCSLCKLVQRAFFILTGEPMNKKTDRSIFPFVLGGFLFCLLLVLIGALFLLPALRRTDTGTQDGITAPALLGTVFRESDIPEGLVPHLHYKQSALPEGTVLAQSPAPGVRCRRGGELDLTLSTPHAGVRLPDIVGKTHKEAIRILTELGLNYRLETEAREDLATGTVLASMPEAGSLIFPMEHVTLVLCQNNTIHIPNVVGMSLNEAILSLESVGAKIGSITKIPHMVASETVLSQSAVGPADANTIVHLVVCN